MSYIQKQPEEDFISIYQTSKLYNDHLSELTLSQLQERGFNIEGIEFYDTTSFDSSSFNYGETSKGTIYIDSDITYQSIIGFGGAFTESSAYIFFKLPVKIRDKFLDAYFGENGIGYTVGRIHINSCDFSLNSYSFDDVPDDYNVIYLFYQFIFIFFLIYIYLYLCLFILKIPLHIYIYIVIKF